jgi:hypothetical protein
MRESIQLANANLRLVVSAENYVWVKKVVDVKSVEVQSFLRTSRTGSSPKFLSHHLGLEGSSSIACGSSWDA